MNPFGATTSEPQSEGQVFDHDSIPTDMEIIALDFVLINPLSVDVEDTLTVHIDNTNPQLFFQTSFTRVYSPGVNFVHVDLNDPLAPSFSSGNIFTVRILDLTSPPINPDAEILTDENLIKYNTAFFTDSNGIILGRYHKIKLLLFGEYLPFAKYIPAIKNISPASGDFTPGDKLDLFEIKEKGARIAPIICYEDIIP